MVNKMTLYLQNNFLQILIYILPSGEPSISFRRIAFIEKCEKWVKFSTLIRLISITIKYMTKLIMQFLRLNETCRMICYSILSNNVSLIEIGFEWL